MKFALNAILLAAIEGVRPMVESLVVAPEVLVGAHSHIYKQH